MGLLNNAIPFSLIFWGQTHITSSLAATLNATTPIFTVLVAHFLTAEEKLSGHRVGGVILGFTGAAVLIGPDLAPVGNDGQAGDWSLAGIAGAAVLLAALSYACASLYGRRFKAMRLGATEVAAGQLTGAALLLPVVAFTPSLWPVAAAPATWGAVIDRRRRPISFISRSWRAPAPPN